MKRHLPLTFALVWTFLSSTVQGASPNRLAVVSDIDAKDLTALLTVELSANPGISLVERDDLAKVGDEKKVQEMAGNDARALGRLVNADGLIFLDKSSGKVRLRFTAVGLGYALFDDEVDPATEPAVIARGIAQRVSGYLPKLKLDPATTIPLSLMNIRSEVRSRSYDEIEHQLSLLLESRLMSVPEYVVLERRHAVALGFEHALSATAPDLLNGAYVIDASFHPVTVESAAKIELSFRIRSPKSDTPITFTLQGDTTDLHALADSIVTKIGQALAISQTPSTWRPQDEAREYMKDGIWAWQRGDNDTAMQALNTAELLGETAPDLHILRSNLLCMLETPKAGKHHGIWTEAPPQPPLKERVELLQQSLRDSWAYNHRGNVNASFLKPVEQGAPIVDQSYKLLEDLDKSSETELTETFRKDFCEYLGFDLAHGKIPGWAQVEALVGSADELFDYYKSVVLSGKGFFYVDPKTGLSRVLKNPDDRQKAYDKYMVELKADPRGRLAWLELSCINGDAATREQLYPQFMAELWKQRFDLSKSVTFQRYITWINLIPADLRQKQIKLALPFYHDALVHPEVWPVDYLFLTWPPTWLSKQDLDDLWKDYEAQRKLHPPDWRGLFNFRFSYMRAFPNFEPPVIEDTLPKLTVSRYWTSRLLDHPDANPDPSTAPGEPHAMLMQFGEMPDGEGVWGRMQWDPLERDTGVFEVHLPDMTSKYYEVKGSPFSCGAARTSKALFVSYALYGNRVTPHVADEYFLKRYDFASGTWAERRVTDITEGKMEAVKDQLYLDLGKSADTCGIGRYDWDTDKLTILASSQRRPQQNQFDDSQHLHLGLLAGPGNKPCLVGPGGFYFAREDAGPWPRFDYDVLASFNRPVECGSKTLLASNGGEVVLVDPTKDAPIPLMAPTVPREWHTRPGEHQQAIQLPLWAAQASWKFQPEWTSPPWSTDYDYHEGCLYYLSSQSEDRGSYLLRVFRPGLPDPVSIPLHFAYKGSDEMGAKLLKWDDGRARLFATKAGLCLQNLHGFWFIPYGDIDAFIKAASN